MLPLLLNRDSVLFLHQKVSRIVDLGIEDFLKDQGLVGIALGFLENRTLMTGYLCLV